MRVLCAAAALVAMAFPVAAQQKQMAPKSQKELEAIQAVINATTPDAKMAAVDKLIADFKTDFKGWALDQAAEAARIKRDGVKAQFYANEALKFDSKDYQAMLLLSGEIAQATRDTDLDKDDKLAKAEKFAKDAMPAIEAAVNPNPQGIPADQWEGIKKDYLSQAHEDLGVIAVVRKKPDAAAAEFKLAVEVAAHPEPATIIRLASSYNDGNKPDQALEALAKIPADANDTIKRFAASEKQRAEKLKTGK